MALPRTLVAPVSGAPGDHLAWAVDRPDALGAVLVPYLHEGASRHERLIVVAGGNPDSVAGGLASLPDRDGLIARGQLRLQPAESTYAPLRAGDVWGQAALFKAEADRAVADGFTGIRVWADVTPLAGTECAMQRFMDYETAVEKTFRESPLTAVCALDVAQAAQHWSRMSSRHRARRDWRSSTTVAVELYDNVVHLIGEVDIASLGALEDNLDSVRRLTTGALLVDLADLDFLDVSGSRAIGRFARSLQRQGRSVRVVGATGVIARVLDVSSLPDRDAAG